MDALRAAWQARTSREHTAVGVGAVVVTSLLLYGFVWEPLRADRARLREIVPHLRTQSAQFTTDAAEARRLRGQGHSALASEPPRAVIESAAVESGMRPRIRSVTEVASGRFQVAVEPVSYEALIQWVGALASSDGIALEAVQLRPGATPGTVVVDTLVLKGRGES
jgi:type II secretory pathway component PulM